VIVTWNSVDSIAATLDAVRRELGSGDRVVVVDNASTDGTVDAVRASLPEATVVETGANLGFAGGCNAGAAAADTPLLLFLNPDAFPEPGCFDALRAVAPSHPRWGAWQAAVTLPDGTLNTGGGVVHFLGLSWAGRYGEPVDALGADPAEVGFASGAALVVRRDLWNRLGGFDEAFFMYAEDVDVSLRVRLAGYRVGVAPAARVVHDYDFDKGDRKWFLLERNRWWTVVATYPPAVLAAVLPAMLLVELPILAAAALGGWLPSKLRAQRAVVGSLPAMLRRRRRVQGDRRIGARAFAAGLDAELSSPYLGAAGRSGAVSLVLRTYWALARAALPGRRDNARTSDQRPE
jgi:hypothetical protein